MLFVTYEYKCFDLSPGWVSRSNRVRICREDTVGWQNCSCKQAFDGFVRCKKSRWAVLCFFRSVQAWNMFLEEDFLLLMLHFSCVFSPVFLNFFSFKFFFVEIFVFFKYQHFKFFEDFKNRLLFIYNHLNDNGFFVF